MNKKVLNVVSLGLTIAGGIISVVSSIVADKKTDGIIAEKVAEAINKQLEQK